ncbi:MAG: MotA/TolQ/ExbB proton channel family protein [Deltaproteobacteria bacterium]|nr:MotA/TolQ/ExbB proton channel family protein [Deltaproteobacteria bacterium]
MTGLGLASRLTALVALGGLLVLVPGPAPAATWAQAAAQVKARARQAQEEAALTQKMFKEDRARLLAQRQDLAQEAARAEAELNRLQARFEKLLKTEEAKRTELAASQVEIKNLEAVIRLAAGEAETLLRGSLATADNPARLKVLAPLRNKDRFPGLEDLAALVDVLFEEMEASGQIRLGQGTFIDPAGRQAEGRLLRLGSFTAYFQKNDVVGFLRLDQTGTRLTALAQEPAWRMSRSIKKYFSGQGNDLPLDPSGGTALAHLRQSRDFLDWLLAGGFLIWPILFLAAVALVLIGERLVSLGRVRANTDGLMEQIKSLAQKGEWQECRAVCSRNARAPACQVVLAGLDNRGQPQEVVETAMEEAILKQMPRLERFLPTLSVLAAIAPLLGLLGTVTGMIDTFQVITLLPPSWAWPWPCRSSSSTTFWSGGWTRSSATWKKRAWPWPPPVWARRQR